MGDGRRVIRVAAVASTFVDVIRAAARDGVTPGEIVEAFANAYSQVLRESAAVFVDKLMKGRG